jgi:heme/copper-type cytochrome/quinol oxidase subunit 2
MSPIYKGWFNISYNFRMLIESAAWEKEAAQLLKVYSNFDFLQDYTLRLIENVTKNSITTTDKATTDKATTDKAAIDKAAIDKATIDTATIDTTTTDIDSSEDVPSEGWFFEPDPTHPDFAEYEAWDADEDYLDELSSPNFKVYYPEPFIASPSFIFEDLWFIHILHFAHWLWFFFISLIMFFFITFVITVRHCNPRNKPKRETRGVSRSKCADVITACVPVSWALAIIISETVDATDYYDGFGTGEIVVGIRAYQWGWEYFYPKGINLNHTVNSTFAMSTGNSLKYTNSSELTASVNALWRHLQNNNTSLTNTPSHLLLTSNSNSKTVNFLNFSSIGSNVLKEQEAFKRIQFSSKTNQKALFNSKKDFESSYGRVITLYDSDQQTQDTLNYGSLRQHNLTSMKSSNANFSNMLEMRTLRKFLDSKAGNQQTFKSHELSSNLKNVKRMGFGLIPAQAAATFMTTFATAQQLNSSLGAESKSSKNLTLWPADSGPMKNVFGLTKYSNVLDDRATGAYLKAIFKTECVNLGVEGLPERYWRRNLFRLTKLVAHGIIKDPNLDNIILNQSKTRNTLFTKSSTRSSLPCLTESRLVSNPSKFALINKPRKPLKGLSFTQNPLSLIKKSTNFKASNSSWSLDTRNLLLSPKSQNRQLLPAERNTRLIANFNSSEVLKNFTGADWQLPTTLNLTPLNSLLTASQNGSSLSMLSKLGASSNSVPLSHSPIFSSNPLVNATGYDRFGSSLQPQTSSVMKSKEELVSPHVFNSYWVNSWQHVPTSTRFWVNTKLLNNLSSLYMPTPTNYAEYDFQNWQMGEIMEDLFWESTNPSFAQDELMLSLSRVKQFQFFSKQEEFFNHSNRSAKVRVLRKNSLLAPLSRDIALETNTASPSVFSNELVNNVTLMRSADLINFSDSFSLDNLEEPYDSVKNLKHLVSSNSKNLRLTVSKAVRPLSYTSLLDPFRADFEEVSWGNEFVDSFSKKHYTSPEALLSTGSRFTNEMHLRGTTKNAIVTYNAIQKVFKSRFDESRSNAKLTDFSSSSVKHPMITDTRTPYESLLGKNKESFFSPVFFSRSMDEAISSSTSSAFAKTAYFAQLPFLISGKSDAARYLWFDWQSKWSSMEVQPSSISRYSLLGLPYLNKSFDYSSSLSEEIQDSEDYLTKLSKARKNYLSNWSYSPYFYTRTSAWFKFNNLFDSLFEGGDLSQLKTVLKTTKSSWRSASLSANTIKSFSSGSSDYSTPGRSTTQARNGAANYAYSVNTLTSLLSKREHFYRRLYSAKGNSPQLSQFFVSGPNHPLLVELRKSLPISDPTNISSEVSKEFFYQNPDFLKLKVFKTYSDILCNSIGLGQGNPILSHFFGFDESKLLETNRALFKNQYRPMRKGISSMVRLQATGAIALPIETRLHILASSKDVIHSWAVPGAGIKIDCVPGYSSHRVTIFFLSGIFYGQCMEICGRYHHWMPITVFFLKSDAFLLWSLHHTGLSTRSSSHGRASDLIGRSPAKASI